VASSERNRIKEKSPFRWTGGGIETVGVVALLGRGAVLTSGENACGGIGMMK
jgi:hypothetical protein